MRDVAELIDRIPDLPRWVEARGMLLSARGHVLGVGDGPEPSGVTFQPDTRSAVVIGFPGERLVREAAGLADYILAAPEHSAAVSALVPGWKVEHAIQHLHPELSELPDSEIPELPAEGRSRSPGHLPTFEDLTSSPAEPVRRLEPGEFSRAPDLPDELRGELAVEDRAGTPIAAVLVDERPVAFCYAGAISETLWDLSVDTLGPYRGRGFAGRCAAYLIRHLAEAGKQPVWGAVDTNVASLRVAAKLGFQPVDSIGYFTRPGLDDG